MESRAQNVRRAADELGCSCAGSDDTGRAEAIRRGATEAESKVHRAAAGWVRPPAPAPLLTKLWRSARLTPHTSPLLAPRRGKLSRALLAGLRENKYLFPDELDEVLDEMFGTTSIDKVFAGQVTRTYGNPLVPFGKDTAAVSGESDGDGNESADELEQQDSPPKKQSTDPAPAAESDSGSDSEGGGGRSLEDEDAVAFDLVPGGGGGGGGGRVDAPAGTMNLGKLQSWRAGLSEVSRRERAKERRGRRQSHDGSFRGEIPGYGKAELLLASAAGREKLLSGADGPPKKTGAGAGGGRYRRRSTDLSFREGSSGGNGKGRRKVRTAVLFHCRSTPFLVFHRGFGA